MDKSNQKWHERGEFNYEMTSNQTNWKKRITVAYSKIWDEDSMDVDVEF